MRACWPPFVLLLALASAGGAQSLCVHAQAAVELPVPAPSRDLADALLRQGRFQEALVEYRAWLAQHADDAAAHNRLGLCLQKTGDGKAARRAYTRATELDRCYAEAWNNLGTVEHVGGRFKKAVAAYRKAIECKPETAQFHRNLGSAYLDLDDLPRSAHAYNEALRIDPAILDTVSGLEVSVSSATAAKRYFALARACAIHDQPAAAVRFLRRARTYGYTDFDQAVASEPAFAGLLANPLYAELLRSR
jgi:Flp pilus assembly protein TadD